MQMLIYLFALKTEWGAKKDIVPAAVLCSAGTESFRPQETQRRLKLMRPLENCGGAANLCEKSVIEAMEHGGSKKYLPVKFTKQVASPESLVAQQLDKLSLHRQKLLQIAGSI